LENLEKAAGEITNEIAATQNKAANQRVFLVEGTKYVAQWTTNFLSKLFC